MATNHVSLLYMLALCIAVIAACCDIRWRRIPNWLTLSGLSAALALQLYQHGWHGVLNALLSVACAGGLFFCLFLAGGMGGGDVKLIAALSACVGLAQVVPLLMFTAMAGGVMAIIVLIARRCTAQVFRNALSILRHHCREGLVPHPEHHVRNEASIRLPYGVAIATGYLLVCLSEWKGKFL